MVTNFFSNPVFAPMFFRNFCHNVSVYAERLENRSVVKLFGNELFYFIQGLITNDIYSLTSQQKSLYTFLLNSKGRILYDTLLYKISDTEILLECDYRVRDGLIKHLKSYCIRKKIDIVPQDYSVWAVFNGYSMNDFSNSNGVGERLNDTLSFVESKINFEDMTQSDVLVFKDPRLSALGFRIFSSTSVDVAKRLSSKEVTVCSSEEFSILRYKLGVSEGVNELPVGSCFPHEANGDYLHGISFNKGCYIGQELTARIQYTGVVRKRLMPLILSYVPDFNVEEGSEIKSKEDKNVGKLRFLRQNFGIALLRVSEALESKSDLKVTGISARTYEPFWWPRLDTNSSAHH